MRGIFPRQVISVAAAERSLCFIVFLSLQQHLSAFQHCPQVSYFPHKNKRYPLQQLQSHRHPHHREIHKPHIEDSHAKSLVRSLQGITLSILFTVATITSDGTAVIAETLSSNSLSTTTKTTSTTTTASKSYDGFADYAKENKMQQSDVGCFIKKCGEQTKALFSNPRGIKGVSWYVFDFHQRF